MCPDMPQTCLQCSEGKPWCCSASPGSALKAATAPLASDTGRDDGLVVPSAPSHGVSLAPASAPQRGEREAGTPFPEGLDNLLKARQEGRIHD